MPNELTTDELAQRYFDPQAQLYFRWEEEGKILTWDNGTTIAFREELAAVMRRLSTECLPPWPAIATLLSACRDNWKSARELLIESVQFDGKPSDEWQTTLLTQIVGHLDAIHGLPKELRHSLDARCELAAMVFENQSGIFSEHDAEQLANLIADGMPSHLQPGGGIQENLQLSKLADQDPVTAPAEKRAPQSLEQLNEERRKAVSALVRDLRWLGGRLHQVDGEALRRRIRTGIESELSPTAANVGPSTRQFISELLHDEKLGGIARAAQRLLSVVTLPRRLSEPDTLPIGGVSDVTNRGTLDKLLLTELAHEDTTLAVRIANNEAMYFRRESPPTQRALTRQVLLDTGLTMWGIPKVLATATALALQATNDDSVCINFFTNPVPLTAVDLLTKEGIESHLSNLSTGLAPNKALSELADESSEHSEERPEIVVITSNDAAQTPAFLRQLETTSAETVVFLFTIFRTGIVEFYECSFRGRRLLRSVHLPLEQILPDEQSSSGNRLIRTNTTAHFPAILSLAEFPLRLSMKVEPEQCFQSTSETAVTTRDGRLVVWDRNKAGARQISDQIGPGRLLWHGFDEKQNPVVVFGSLANEAMRIVRPANDDCQIIPFVTQGHPTKVTGHADRIFVTAGKTVEVFASSSGKALSVVDIPPNFTSETRRPGTHSRFFQSSGRCFALAQTPNGADFVEVGRAAHFHFDCRNFGIVEVMHQTMRCMWNDQEISFDATPKMVSSDGYRVLIQMPSGKLLVSEFTGKTFSKPVASRNPFWQIGVDRSAFRQRTPRRHIRTIGLLDGRLVLTMKKGSRLLIDHQDTLTLRPTSESPDSAGVEFLRTDAPTGVQYELRVAEFHDGSRAFLDSRGLLHLVSSDRSLPQLTIILCDGRMCGWLEGQGLFGIEYYSLDGKATTEPEDRQNIQPVLNSFIRCIE